MLSEYEASELRRCVRAMYNPGDSCVVHVLEEVIDRETKETGGQYPRGKLNDADEGELDVRLFVADGDTVVMDFGKPTPWIGMDKRQAVEFGETLIRLGTAS